MRPDPAGSLARVRELARAQLGVVAERRPGRRHLSRLAPSWAWPVRAAVDEIAILREELGPMPLIGLVTDAEIFDGMMHEAAGVLVLIA